jgi:hypothetical protein
MTNNRGYIYVLANSAMPDLVKVGKTTRTPAERAAELSKVTGVPTPFIVVYEQLVDDCTAAEEFVHTMLQQKGYRESDNREFFRAPVSEVIQIIIKIPTHFSSNSDVEEDEDAEFFSSESDDELDEFFLDDDEKPDYPWLGLWNAAWDYTFGNSNCIQDKEEAINLYKQAIKLGCLPAYKMIGDIYFHNKNQKKALDWYKDGAKKGDYFCYPKMAELFRLSNQLDNYHKCIKLFFKQERKCGNNMLERFGNSFTCDEYISYCFIYDTFPMYDVIKESSASKEDVILSLENEVKERFPNFKDKRGLYSAQEQEFIKPYETLLKWAEENL